MTTLLIIGAVLIILIGILSKTGKSADASTPKAKQSLAHSASSGRTTPPSQQPTRSIAEEKTALERLIEQKKREGMVPTERYLSTFCFRLEYPEGITESEQNRAKQLQKDEKLQISEKGASIEICTIDNIRVGQVPHQYYLDIFRYTGKIKSAKVANLIDDRGEQIVLVEITMPDDYLPTIMTFVSEDKHTLQRDYPEFDLASILKYEDRNPELSLQLFREFEAKHHHTENLRGQLYCLRVLKRRDEEIALLEEMLRGQYANWDEFKLRLDTVKKLKASDMRKAEFERGQALERNGNLEEALMVYQQIYDDSKEPTTVLMTRIQSCLHKLGRFDDERQFILQILESGNLTAKAKEEFEKRLAKLG